MAKRKNSTALFEVMRAAQQKSLPRQDASGRTVTPSTAIAPPRSERAPAQPPLQKQQVSAPRSFAPPSGQSRLKPPASPAVVIIAKRWLSSLLEKRPAIESHVDEAAETALDPSDPTAGITAHSLASRASRPTPAPPVPPAVASSIRGDHSPAVAHDRQQPIADDTGMDIPPTPAARPFDGAIKRLAQAAVSRSRARSGTGAAQLAIDRDNQQVTVKVRFQTVIIGVVAALAVVGLAYIVGKQAGAPAAKTPTSAEIRNGKAQPGVLDPRGAAADADARAAGDRQSGASASVSHAANGSTVVRAGEGFFEDALTADGKANRSTTLNYCVIATYSPSQQQWAFDVRDYLNGAGIPCTIEIGRPNIHTRHGDYLIVGTRGFAPRFGDTATYNQYLESIERAARSFPDKSKFGKPQTFMVRWVNEASSAG